MRRGASGGERGALKMSELVARSGVSRELVHHYLREGLLPPPRGRARYDEVHLRLLGLVKRLRDERFLPLEVIRELVVYLDHDPERLEIVLLSGAGLVAAAQQRARQPNGAARLSERELEAASGASRELVQRCVAAGLVAPEADGFGRAEASVVALVRHGVALGIPLDSFRTIRRYVEMAFALERVLFMPRVEPTVDLVRLGRDVAVRKELANAFVASVLGSLVERELAGELGPTAAASRSFAAAAYRPSDAFLQKHGVKAALEALEVRLHARPRDRALVARRLELLALAGRDHELVFALEQPRAPLSAARLHGYALVLVGETERAVEVLAPLAAERRADALVLASLAVAELGRASAPVEAALPAVGRAVAHAEAALAAARGARSPEADEARLFAGYVLASAPASAARGARGVAALVDVYARAGQASEVRGLARAARLRLRIASACVLHRVLARAELHRSARAAAPPRAELCTEVLRLDPASEAALELYAHGGRE
ncbi:MAG: MerR family transcriptional regulator [Polyangiaceae bacterium]|nr:MerR family transcriptional regulator [Polyangiaceae bacterium]